MKEILPIACLMFTISIIGQDSRTKITGKIESDSIPIINAHVINLNSNMGTVSNEKGYFEISVKLNDTLQISELSSNSIKIIIDEYHTKSKTFVVKLQTKVNELDEIIIDKLKITKGINASILQLPNAGKKPLDQNERKLNFYSQESVPIVILATLLGQSGGIDDIYNIVSGNRKKHRKLKMLLDQDKLDMRNKKEIEEIRFHFKDEFFIQKFELEPININAFLKFCLKDNVSILFHEQRYIELINVFVLRIDQFKTTILD